MKVLVTGGSRGIGKEICKIFKDHNHEVISPTRNELDLSDRKSIKEFISNYNKK